tara:strand:+ start:2956 stop:3240 length:285 start_codon:yes stop_codon:yes gene_type:complete
MEHNTADGGVIVAHWRVTDSETVGEDTYSASAYSTASFTYDASSPDFVPYADLTEEMVLGWCFDGDVDKDAVEASLTANIEEQKNPTTEDGVPW